MKHKLLSLVLLIALLLTACAPSATPIPLESPTPAPSATPAPATATPEASPTAVATKAPTATVAASAAFTPVSVSDGLGGTLKFDSAPKAIVSLAPSTTEILFAVGAGAQIAAREDFTNYPDEAAKLPSVGGLTGPVSLEQIVAYKPDLVIVAPITPPELIKSIQNMKIPVLELPNPKSLSDMYAIVQLAAQVTGHTSEADALIVQLQAREKKVAEVVAKATSKPLVYYELDATDPSKPWTSGPGTFIDLLITLAGAKNIGADLKGEWVQISQEDLLVKNPDIIILGNANFGMTPEKVAARPGWNALQAVKNNQVFPINDDLVSRPGPRMLDGLETMVKLVHPELADQLK